MNTPDSNLDEIVILPSGFATTRRAILRQADLNELANHPNDTLREELRGSRGIGIQAGQAMNTPSEPYIVPPCDHEFDPEIKTNGQSYVVACKKCGALAHVGTIPNTPGVTKWRLVNPEGEVMEEWTSNE